MSGDEGTTAPVSPAVVTAVRYGLLAATATLLGAFTAYRSPAVQPLEFLTTCAVAAAAVVLVQFLIPKRLIGPRHTGAAAFYFLWWGAVGALLLYLRQP